MTHPYWDDAPYIPRHTYPYSFVIEAAIEYGMEPYCPCHRAEEAA